MFLLFHIELSIDLTGVRLIAVSAWDFVTSSFFRIDLCFRAVKDVRFALFFYQFLCFGFCGSGSSLYIIVEYPFWSFTDLEIVRP